MFRGGVVALAIGLALVAWLLSRDHAEESAGNGPSKEVVSAAELRAAANSLPYAVYWAGPLPGTELQLVESPGGTLVVYLGGGEADTEALTVGSYPIADPGGELAEFAARPDSETRRDAGGREVVFSRSQPTSVYFADPVGGVQVEVYDPSPARALALALSPRVRPVR